MKHKAAVATAVPQTQLAALTVYFRVRAEVVMPPASLLQNPTLRDVLASEGGSWEAWRE